MSFLKKLQNHNRRKGGGGGGGEEGGATQYTHTAYEFLRFNVVSSGTHNNVPAYLAGRKYSELPGSWPLSEIHRERKKETDTAEWILETAGRNGYVTAFVVHVYVCVCVCVCVYVFVFGFVCVCVCVCVCMYMYIYIYIYTCIYIYTSGFSRPQGATAMSRPLWYIYIRVCVYGCIYIYVCICIYIYVCIGVY